MNDLIDYSDDSTEIDMTLWTHTAFKNFFTDVYRKAHHVGGALPWTIKETVLLKRMMEEFKAEDLADMMSYWHLNHKSSIACQFVNFYSNRIDIYHKWKEAIGEYSWE